jgi:hypothetical protein
MPSTMAPTKAKAMYAVTTLNPLTNGRKVIGILLNSRHCPPYGQKLAMRALPKKAGSLSIRLISAPHNRATRG